MAAVADILNLDNELFRTYLFYCCVLVLKMLIMSPLTGRQRFKNKAFANKEDLPSPKVAVKVNEDVERVRRAHLNDLENIPIFFVASFAYILTNPSVTLATNLFRLFTLGRLCHTLVYAIYVVPQPARAISWATGFAITIYMAVQGILYFK